MGMNTPETFTLSALRIPWFQFLFQSNHQEMVCYQVSNEGSIDNTVGLPK